MSPHRRIAILFDPDDLGRRQHAIVAGICRFAGERAGWHLVFDRFATHRPAGWFAGCVATAHRGRGWILRHPGMPLVCVDWAHPRARVPRALESRYDAGRLAARHLLERGYATFAYIGFKFQRQSRTEWAWFRKELRSVGKDASAARGYASHARQRDRTDRLLHALAGFLDKLAKPVGIFVARPGLARTVADLALSLGLRVPEDVGIIAADDDPVICALPPALTSLHFDYGEVGYRAAELLSRLIDGEAAPVWLDDATGAGPVDEEMEEPLGHTPHRVGIPWRPWQQAALIAPTLVPRLSTDRAAIADPFVAKALYYIDDRRTESIDPRQVAAGMGVALRTLEVRFQLIRGRTIQQEIARARVEHAKLLLARSDLTLRAVAANSGFGSYDALLRAFKRHAGELPSAWRRNAMLRRQGSPDAEPWHDRRTRRSRSR
ncbi:MAG: substrate-binding domain-containing protein [Candidatus Brocadiae bacterium]|nr:substrate-binding domain-containing protein [Candidatus Brocadiia bacterium]